MMRASVKSDKATRVVEMDLVPEGSSWDTRDFTATWRDRDKPRMFRPDHARLVLLQGEDDEGRTVWEATSISVSGQLVLKSGAASTAEQSRDRMVWRAGAWATVDRIDHAPEWVQEIVRQVPLGITAYTWTDSERAEEVQSL